MSYEIEWSLTDNTQQADDMMTEAIRNFLEEAGAEIETAAKRNSRVRTGDTRESFTHVVDMQSNSGEATIGSNHKNAIWEEFGTGEYASEGGGRQGGWKYQDEKGQWHFTRGKQPNKALDRAFKETEGQLESRLASIFEDAFGG